MTAASEADAWDDDTEPDLIGMAEHTQDVVTRVTEIVEHYRGLADPDAAANSIRQIGDVLDD